LEKVLTDPVPADAGTNETAENGTVANGTTGNGTVANGTAGNETAGNETTGDSSDGEATIIVSNVSLNRTAVAVNESVAVNVTLANQGDAEATYTAGLPTIPGMNVSTAGTESVAVPPGEVGGRDDAKQREQDELIRVTLP
jgi:hypothetical protein